MASWSCTIGDVDRADLPPEADAPLRAAVRQAFEDLFGREDDVCSSGWGLNDVPVEGGAPAEANDVVRIVVPAGSGSDLFAAMQQQFRDQDDVALTLEHG